MSKHTPGPWTVVAIDWAETGNARFEIKGIRRTGMADARLIAAAPDLLEALKELSRSFIGTYSDDQRSDDEINNHREHLERMARAAIAKAEGGAA